MRYRDLETGSFITRDPLGFVDGPNLYSYVRQNPWTAFDPEGLNEVVVSGGVCVEPKTDPEHHDTDGDHFLTAAKLEISARKEKVKQGEQVEWLVDRGTYDARGKLEKKDYLKQIEGMAKDMGAVLRWFDGKDELTDALNHGTDGKDRSGSGLISRFTYFGHGRPGALMTKYDGSADFEADDLAGGRLNRRAFASGASATSFGCNSASPQYNEHESQTPNGQPSFRDAWQNATGVPMAGLIGKSDYSPLNRGSTARVMTDLFCFPLTDFSGPRPPQCGNQNWGPNRGQPSYWVPKQ